MRVIAAARQLGTEKAESIFPASSEFGYVISSSFSAKKLLAQTRKFTIEEGKTNVVLDVTAEDLATTAYSGSHFISYHCGGIKPSPYTFFDHSAPIGSATICFVIDLDETEAFSLDMAKKLIFNALNPETSLGEMSEHLDIFTTYGDRHTALPAIGLKETKDILTKTVTKAVERGEKIDAIAVKAEELELAAQEFRLQAGRLSEQGCWAWLARLLPSSMQCTIL